MTAKNKRRGNDFEREVVQLAKAVGLTAERAYASDGRACGWPKEADVKIGPNLFSCKRRKRLPAYLLAPDELTGTIVRQDGDRQAYVVIPLQLWLAALMAGGTIGELVDLRDELIRQRDRCLDLAERLSLEETDRLRAELFGPTVDEDCS